MSGAPFNSAGAWASHESLRAQLGKTTHAASSRGVVFAHDLIEPFSIGQMVLIDRVDSIYSVIPAPRGWPIFYERSGIEPSGTYTEYIDVIKDVISGFGKPTFLICPKREATLLSAHPPRAIKMHGLAGATWLAVANAEPPQAEREDALLAELAQRYASVYDFGCGYGNSLRPFAYFVGSDIDQRCLDYVARAIL